MYTYIKRTHTYRIDIRGIRAHTHTHTHSLARRRQTEVSGSNYRSLLQKSPIKEAKTESISEVYIPSRLRCLSKEPCVRNHTHGSFDES